MIHEFLKIIVMVQIIPAISLNTPGEVSLPLANVNASNPAEQI